MKKLISIVCLWGIGIVILGVNLEAVEGISCNEAITNLMPCLPYLKGSVPKPVVPCCEGAQKVSKLADTTQIRRYLCECFKKSAAALRIDPVRAKDLPQLCAVQVPVPIDPKVDCSSVPYAGGFV